MSEHDESLIDKVKNALGMGGHDRGERDERHMESGVPADRPVADRDEAEEAAVADAREVRTEYEMGQELDPEHETRAESGFSAPTRSESASGESPFRDADEDEDDTARR
jgi:hypothetical protein